MSEATARRALKAALAAFPERYALPSRPSATLLTVADAYRQTQFLLANDLAVFEHAMNLQLALVAENAKARGPRAAALFSYWSRAFSHLGDACAAMTHGSYVSCPLLLRAALDCIAAQRSLAAGEYAEYEEWFPEAVSQEKELRATAFDVGRFRASSALAEDERLGSLYRLLMDLSMPHFGSTLFQAAPDSNLQKVSLAFADNAFHLGWAEAVTGWLVMLAGAQLETAASSGVVSVSKRLQADCEGVMRDVAGILANRRRCYVEEKDGQFVFHNFRRAASGQPKRVVFGDFGGG